MVHQPPIDLQELLMMYLNFGVASAKNLTARGHRIDIENLIKMTEYIINIIIYQCSCCFPI